MLRAISVARSMSFEAPVVTESRAENQLLGDAPAEQRRDAALEPALAGAVAVRLRQEHRDAERAAARDDRDLVDRIVVRAR